MSGVSPDFILALVLGVGGVTAGAFKVFRTRDEPAGDLVARLDKRISDLEEDLDDERKGRAEDRRLQQLQIEEMRKEYERQLEQMRDDMKRMYDQLRAAEVQLGLIRRNEGNT